MAHNLRLYTRHLKVFQEVLHKNSKFETIQMDLILEIEIANLDLSLNIGILKRNLQLIL